MAADGERMLRDEGGKRQRLGSVFAVVCWNDESFGLNAELGDIRNVVMLVLTPSWRSEIDATLLFTPYAEKCKYTSLLNF